MKVEKRSKVQIYFDILQILCDEAKNEKPSLTKVAHLANLPYDRFQKCLHQLVQLGMVSCAEGGKIFVTEKGLEYIDECMKFNNFLKKMGLLP
ncbi:MAG: winged helix-turn-helix domain-containing protein [Candidatus Bathyarchaeia archaeon]